MRRIIEHIREELSADYSAGEISALTRILATELLGVKESTFFLKDAVELDNEKQLLLDNALADLKVHRPIQHILGYENFCGLQFEVNGSVLIPRPETQELVAWIADDAQGCKNILDIGTGSGCIAISLAQKLKGCRVTAWDISTEALAVARKNSANNGCNVTFEQRDILSYTPKKECFDIIVSNPPYIKEEEKAIMEANVLDWEPQLALFVPNETPLLFYRAIAEKALTMLCSSGKLYFEINRAYGKEICAMLQSLGYRDIELRKDFADNDRMIKAIKG
ncbi:MAG: peptide chain release factor N(5)-glutamine methyltransferase [Bacteroidaceae bacterium]|nr:peptide chain release factor N(5)-glutamine methyltransferase [Bacteroidaceae bacterium]